METDIGETEKEKKGSNRRGGPIESANKENKGDGENGEPNRARYDSEEQESVANWTHGVSGNATVSPMTKPTNYQRYLQVPGDGHTSSATGSQPS